MLLGITNPLIYGVDKESTLSFVFQGALIAITVTIAIAKAHDSKPELDGHDDTIVKQCQHD